MSDSLLEKVRFGLNQDPFWGPYLETHIETQPANISVHLAVCAEPYLKYIIDGKKTIESRFSVNQTPPYGRVKRGDVLLLKEVAGPIVGICGVEHVWSYCIDSESLGEVRSQFAEALCADEPAFWECRANSAFATLMLLHDVKPIEPIQIDKRDRRGWVVLRKRSRQLLLWDR